MQSCSVPSKLAPCRDFRPQDISTATNSHFTVLEKCDRSGSDASAGSVAAALVCCPRWRCVEGLTLTLTRLFQLEQPGEVGRHTRGSSRSPGELSCWHSPSSEAWWIMPAWQSLCCSLCPRAWFSSLIFVFVVAGGGGMGRSAVCLRQTWRVWWWMGARSGVAELISSRALHKAPFCISSNQFPLSSAKSSALCSHPFLPRVLSSAWCSGFRQTARHFPHPTWPPFVKSSWWLLAFARGKDKIFLEMQPELRFLCVGGEQMNCSGRK